MKTVDIPEFLEEAWSNLTGDQRARWENNPGVLVEFMKSGNQFVGSAPFGSVALGQFGSADEILAALNVCKVDMQYDAQGVLSSIDYAQLKRYNARLRFGSVEKITGQSSGSYYDICNGIERMGFKLCQPDAAVAACLQNQGPGGRFIFAANPVIIGGGEDPQLSTMWLENNHGMGFMIRSASARGNYLYRGDYFFVFEE